MVLDTHIKFLYKECFTFSTKEYLLQLFGKITLQKQIAERKL